MSSDYRIGLGHGVALGSLTVLSPQPEGRPVRATEDHGGLSGADYGLGLYAEWYWPLFYGSTDYNTLLTTLGLASLAFADVTVYTRNQRLVYTRYNAVIHLPILGKEGDWSRSYLRGVTFRLTHLEAL